MPGTKSPVKFILINSKFTLKKMKEAKKTNMKTNKTNIKSSAELIGQQNYKQYLEIQATYGFAQRGGTKVPFYESSQSKRLVSNINILESAELKKLVFNEIIFGN